MICCLPAIVGWMAVAMTVCAVPSSTRAVSVSRSWSYCVPAIVSAWAAALAVEAVVAEFASRRATREALAVCLRARLSWRLATVLWSRRTARLRRFTDFCASDTLIWTDATDVFALTLAGAAEAVAGTATTAARVAATATERRNCDMWVCPLRQLGDLVEAPGFAPPSRDGLAFSCVWPLPRPDAFVVMRYVKKISSWRVGAHVQRWPSRR